MSRFDSAELLASFRSTGALPAIHEPIAQLITRYGGEHSRVMDLGCCFGLLSARLAQMGFGVIGVDGNPRYLRDAVVANGVGYVFLKVDSTSRAIKLAEIAAQTGITLVVARRILPEIAESRDPDLVEELGAALWGAGVKAIALEGRVQVPRPRNPLYTADLECEALGKHWKVTDQYRNCRWLEAA